VREDEEEEESEVSHCGGFVDRILVVNLDLLVFFVEVSLR